MKYTVSIDVPKLEEGIRFYADAFGFVETDHPVKEYAVMKAGSCEIGILEKPAGSSPAKDCNDVRRYGRHWTPVHIDFHVEDFGEALTRALQAGAIIEQEFHGTSHPPAAFCSDPFGNGFCIIGKRLDD